MKELREFIKVYFESHGFNTYWLPIYADLLALYSRILNTEYPKPYIQDYLTAISLRPDQKGVDAEVERCRGTVLEHIGIPDLGCSSGSQDMESFLFWAIEDVHARQQSAEFATLRTKLEDLEREKRKILEAMGTPKEEVQR